MRRSGKAGDFAFAGVGDRLRSGKEKNLNAVISMG
jgi:hypothetical protein